VHWPLRIGNWMSANLTDLYLLALEIAAIVALPVIAVVAVVGIVVGLVQSITGVSDQNLSFGPKVAAVALMAILGSAPALALLEMLARQTIRALPYLAH
jgi:flagellar biosynthesis protein FliQ